MVAIVPQGIEESYVNQHVALARPNKENTPRYLAWFIASEHDGKRQLLEAKRGATKAGLGLPDIRNLEIPLPPLKEQRRIADKLDTTFAAVEACKQKLNNAAETIRRFRQSVLAAAISGELTREWREERGIEMEWLQTTIDSIATVGTGSTPLRSNSSFYAKKGIPWVTSSATSEEFVESSEEFVTQTGIESARLKTYPIGTLLVAMYGEGKTRGQVSELKIEATINQACASIHSFKEDYLKEFTKLALKANYLNMRKLAEGGNQPNLNLKKIKTFPIGIPEKEEALKISEIVNKLFKHSKSIENRIKFALQVTENLSASLLAKAFRGELVPQDPNDEPASVLLERIKAQRNAKAAAKKPAKRGRKKMADAAQLVIPEGITDNHLAKMLEECGALSQRALLAASELKPAVFQLQLSKELNAGALKQVDVDGEAAYAHSAWEEEG